MREGRARPHVLRLLDEPDPVMTIILVGHLNLDALLTEILKAKLSHPEAVLDRGTMFAQKVAIAQAIGVLDERQARILRAINKIRNGYAHQLGYSLTFDEAFDLVRLVDECGVDFSDDTIHADKALSAETYGVMGVVHEVLANTFFDLAWSFRDNIPGMDDLIG